MSPPKIDGGTDGGTDGSPTNVLTNVLTDVLTNAPIDVSRIDVLTNAPINVPINAPINAHINAPIDTRSASLAISMVELLASCSLIDFHDFAGPFHHQIPEVPGNWKAPSNRMDLRAPLVGAV